VMRETDSFRFSGTGDGAITGQFLRSWAIRALTCNIMTGLSFEMIA
jgi:hypothetical protein